MTGLIGFSSGYYAMLDCDVLLMLGTDFPYRQFYPDGSGVRIAQVDIRAENIGRRVAVDVGVVGDVRETIQALLPLRDSAHLEQARAHYRKATDDAVFTCDVGLPTVWAARYLAMNGKRRLIGSFWHGSMANAMAQAIGRTGGISRPPGDLALRRRRIHDADGRFFKSRPARAEAERFIQTLIRSWAYAIAYPTSEHRSQALAPWLHFYNETKPHASLNHQPPISRLCGFSEQRS